MHTNAERRTGTKQPTYKKIWVEVIQHELQQHCSSCQIFLLTQDVPRLQHGLNSERHPVKSPINGISNCLSFLFLLFSSTEDTMTSTNISLGSEAMDDQIEQWLQWDQASFGFSARQT